MQVKSYLSNVHHVAFLMKAKMVIMEYRLSVVFKDATTPNIT